MKPTRRQFVQVTLTSMVLFAAGGNTLAKALSAGPSAAGEKKMSVKAAWKTTQVSDNTQMRVFMAWPENAAAKVPGVLVLQEAFGVNEHIRDVTQRIAALGYVTAAPELCHRTGSGF